MYATIQRKIYQFAKTHKFNSLEIGPGKVLSGLIKRIDKNVKVSAINNEEDIKLININD